MASRSLLTNALRIRMIGDNCDHRLSLMEWATDSWTTHPLSFFYADEDGLDKALFEIMVEVLDAEGKHMAPAGAAKLKANVNRTSTIAVAIGEMMDANDAAIPIE